MSILDVNSSQHGKDSIVVDDVEKDPNTTIDLRVQGLMKEIIEKRVVEMEKYEAIARHFQWIAKKGKKRIKEKREEKAMTTSTKQSEPIANKHLFKLLTPKTTIVVTKEMIEVYL
eukprot:m.61487 g.61487  ORF g.61487 m.61487 type:complete len:115 (+) comp11391_c0_seq1:373-717(+)